MEFSGWGVGGGAGSGTPSLDSSLQEMRGFSEISVLVSMRCDARRASDSEGSGRRKNDVLMALDTAAICPAKHFPYLGVGRVVGLFAKIC
jgi:hypothetical protein